MMKKCRSKISLDCHFKDSFELFVKIILCPLKKINLHIVLVMKAVMISVLVISSKDFFNWAS